MNLKLIRKEKAAGWTIGQLYIDGVFVCNTMEDADRGLRQSDPVETLRRKKIHGLTAIPTGTYKVRLDVASPRFRNASWAKPYGGIVPRLADVPAYDGVLIHPLNKAEESEGCIGPGIKSKTTPGMITDSQRYYRNIMRLWLWPAKQRGEDVWITIV